LIVRGFQAQTLQPLFTKFWTQYHMETATPAPVREFGNPIFLHLPYHPLDPSSRVIQKLFREHMLCAGNPYRNIPLPDIRNHRNKKIGVDRLIIAYHRPLNLGNLLCPRKFDRRPGHTVSEHMQIARRFRRDRQQQQQHQQQQHLTRTLFFGGEMCFLTLFFRLLSVFTFFPQALAPKSQIDLVCAMPSYYVGKAASLCNQRFALDFR
jgi:hypothetical protein